MYIWETLRGSQYSRRRTRRRYVSRHSKREGRTDLFKACSGVTIYAEHKCRRTDDSRGDKENMIMYLEEGISVREEKTDMGGFTFGIVQTTKPMTAQTDSERVRMAWCGSGRMTRRIATYRCRVSTGSQWL